MRRKKGFTLMEMLIVVGIIIVLVSIGIPTYTGVVTKAKYSADVANVRTWYSEQKIGLMTENGYIVDTNYFTEDKLEMKGATVTVSNGGAGTSGIDADNLTVVYDPNGSAADDEDYPSVKFPE